MRIRPAPTRPAKPIGGHKLGQLLRDRYYLGKVEYQGEEYARRHEPLISEELFERVQRVLDLDRHGGKRDRVHNHYLKALLWCARCSRRLIVNRGKSKSGNHYFYYLCRGRQEHACDLPPLPIEQLETAVGLHYRTIRLSTIFQTSLKAKINEASGTATALRHESGAN